MFQLPDSLQAFGSNRIPADDLAQHGPAWARAFAPILWFHPRETFYPEDCGNVLAFSQLRRPGHAHRRLSQLTDLGREGRDAHFALDDIDFEYFKVPPQYDPPRAGPEAVSALAARLYGNDPLSGPRHTDFVCYVHLTHNHVDFPTRLPTPRQVSNRRQALSMRYLSRYNGHYLLIRYMFFYAYNDAWNKHVGDWDSTIQLAIPYDVAPRSASSAQRTLAIFSQHGGTWITDRRASSTSLANLVGLWDRKQYRVHGDEQGDVNFGSAFFTGSHVHGFVARGAHAVYPTPGYSQTYLDAPEIPLLYDGPEVPILSDERMLGHFCAYPRGRKTQIARGLGLPLARVRGGEWQDYHVLNALDRSSATWHRYLGRWGQSARWTGWEAPDYPWVRRGFGRRLQPFLLQEEQAVRGHKRYERGKQPRTVLYNIHAI